MKTGDFVKIECDGQTRDGVILFGEGNLQCLALGFDGTIQGVDVIAVLQDDDGVYRSPTVGVVKITPRGEAL